MAPSRTPSSLASESIEPEGDAPPAHASPAPLALASTLLELAAGRETGVLEVSSQALRTRIFLRAGATLSAEGGALRETLGAC